MNDTRQTVLVTGAGGFAGSHLLECLEGPHDLVGWTRSDPPAAVASLARWQQVDLLDREMVRTAVQELRPSAVYHCAGLSGTAGSWHESAPLFAANVLGTHYLLDALRRADVSCRLLLPGSALLYRPSDHSIREQHALAPASPYALSKLAQEQLGLQASSRDGIDVVLTRSFNHTGPRQSPAFVAPAMARQIALIERGALPPVIRVGNLDAVRDITDVRDVARAYVLLMERGAPARPYNVASGVGRTIRSLLDSLLARARRSVRVEFDPSRRRAHDVPQIVGNPALLREATGWEPRIPFEQLIDDLLSYWRGAAFQPPDA